MGRAPLLAALALASVSIDGIRAEDAAAVPPVAVRMVKLAGELADPRVRDHVAFCRDAGFNALWVYSWEAGAWDATRAPKRPIVDPEFQTAARTWSREGLDPWVSINPVADGPAPFVFSDPAGEDRIVAFAALLRKRAGIRHLVLSFDDQPTELTEFADILRYGKSAAPAHLDLVRRIAARLPGDVDLWICAAAYCDGHLGNGQGPYAKPFLEGLPSLPERIGIVWTGPRVISPSVDRAEIEAARARLGGRRLLLYDNALDNEDGKNDAMALLLAPLRNRDPGLASVLSGYVACPMRELGGSRLSLLTVAEWLKDPAGYDPDVAVQHAMTRIAGAAAADPESWAALKTQQLEWGGFVGERNYWPRDALNPAATASRLDDPAFVESFTWTVDRYPARMEALSRLSDARFRDDLLTAMRRRLAIGRAIPPTIEYLVRVRAGRADAAVAKAQLEAERASWAATPDAGRVLDLFLRAAGVPLASEGAP